MPRRPAVPSPVSLAAGVDIGGSKVLAVALDEDREVLAQVRLRTSSGAAGVVESATEAVHRLAAALGVQPGDFEVVGVGVPGLVEPDSGHVDNDVNAAALGAAHVLRLDDSDVAFLSIGTGLAAGLVTNGQLRRGARGAAGEIGHVPVDPAGPICRCGQRGCLETLASGTVRDTFAGHVASAVRLLVLTCDVETVVLGGGVTEVGRPLIDAVVAALHRQAESSPFLAALELASRVAVVPPGSAVAAIGAALTGVAACASGDSAGLTVPR